MKDRMHKGTRALTVEEHLWLHRRMELRAHELWLAGGHRRAATLQNWLQAERETWAAFRRIPPNDPHERGTSDWLRIATSPQREEKGKNFTAGTNRGRRSA